jgi:hypothetical protein
MFSRSGPDGRCRVRSSGATSKKNIIFPRDPRPGEQLPHKILELVVIDRFFHTVHIVVRMQLVTETLTDGIEQDNCGDPALSDLGQHECAIRIAGNKDAYFRAADFFCNITIFAYNVRSATGHLKECRADPGKTFLIVDKYFPVSIDVHGGTLANTMLSH